MLTYQRVNNPKDNLQSCHQLKDPRDPKPWCLDWLRCFGTGRPNRHIDLPTMHEWPPSWAVDGSQLLDRTFEPLKLLACKPQIPFSATSSCRNYEAMRGGKMVNAAKWGLEIKFRKFEDPTIAPQHCTTILHPSTFISILWWTSGQLWHWEYADMWVLLTNSYADNFTIWHDHIGHVWNRLNSTLMSQKNDRLR